MRILTLMMLMVVGCGKGGEITIGEPPKAKPTDQNSTKPTPATLLEAEKKTKREAAGEKKSTLLEAILAENKKERDAAAKKQGTNQPSTTKK